MLCSKHKIELLVGPFGALYCPECANPSTLSNKEKGEILREYAEVMKDKFEVIDGLKATIKSQQETIEKLKGGLEKITRIANGGNRLDDIAWRNAYHTANDLLQPLNK